MSIQLPVATESMRCVDFARANSVDPGGSGLGVDAIALVEIPEPWPKPVARHFDLVDLVMVAQEHPGNTRLLAAVPHDPDHPRVIVLRPRPTGMTRVEVAIGTDGAAALSEALAAEGDEVPTFGGARTVLVCTQGSHDMCCGVEGGALATELENNRPDIELFRVSHTGGHRFAPTAMTLPDGRLWAYLTAPAVGAIIDRVEVDGMARHCRGWWGAPTGRAQVAERAVFDRVGFGVDGLERKVVVGFEDDPDVVKVTAGDRVWHLRVQRGREVPTISCEVPGGEPVKPGFEWDVIEFHGAGQH